jgi:hypothetical protein
LFLLEAAFLPDCPLNCVRLSKFRGEIIMHNATLAAALAIAALFSLPVSVAVAAPSPALAQITSDGSSPIIQVDRRCGPGRRYMPRHRVRGRDGRLHWVGGVCVRNR